jgi:dipeptidyl aminopeptidase/acylaminoacyl peptidase
MTIFNRAAAMAVFLAVAAGSATAQDTGAAFSVDDAINLTSVSSPELSPDGSRVLYIRSELDWGENERKSHIWIANSDGTDLRQFTSQEGDASPAWSPDGRWVAFLRNQGAGDERKRQIFLLRTDGGEARALTSHVTSVQRFLWSDDGARIFFIASDSLATEEKKAREDGADALFVDEGPNGQARGTWDGIWSVAVNFENPDPTRHTPEQIQVGSFAPSPDGAWLAYAYRSENHRNDQYRSEIALVSTDPGSSPRNLTDNEAGEGNLSWAPDGRTLAFVAPDLETWELDQGNLYLLDVESGSVRQAMADWDGNMNSYEWHPDGRFIHLTALERTDSHLYRLDLETDELTRLSNLTGILGSASFSSDHSRVAFTHASPREPGDIHVSSTDPFAPTRITRANPWIDERALAEPQVVRWSSSDGLEIEGLLYVPTGGRADPGAFVLEIHGGPAGVFSRGFDADAQLMTAAGYAVLQPNVRGSSGYGDDLLRGNMNDIGGGDFQDLMTGVDAMIEQGIAHPDSMAVKGWSYGGILGGWTITRTDRFKAASLGAMVADWRSEFGTGFNFDVNRWYLGGDPWSNRDFWLERSSYTHLDRVSTPTILFHGDRDTTDTMEQSMNFFQGLRHLGVPTRFVLFPREGHGIREPRHRRTLLVEEMRWFETHVRGNPDWTPPERPEEEKEQKKAAAT